ncbi:DUF6119 family protein [Undibacterium macrobrachii]|uniref:Sporadically distributed protein, TIGR04141 family n=1 Tax=Undibacterium macrobrachii TaxID=1119058 RepID=A0ABQ2XBN5_9BURK|nr:DUF6119 family protein [Undibacterium macrobrachii]GGX08633.1 hypothetical protein GCM10011282_13460 [Undibacterium macrobrachii]
MPTSVSTRKKATSSNANLETTVDLSIRLMNPGVKSADALKAEHRLVEHDCNYGLLFYETPNAEPPDWANFLESGAPGLKAKLSGQHSSAVLLIEVGSTGATRLFTICFGQGHHAIETDRMERQFGLRVVLNSVARDKLRGLDSASLDSTVIQRRTQASRESDLLEFGLDTNRDLLRLASGKPSDVALAKAMSGKDALQVRKKMAISSLPHFCAELLNIYNATEYKKDFKFIDQIKPVHRGALLDDLNAALFSELRDLVAGKLSDLHLAVPDFLGPDQVPELCYYGSNLPQKKERFSTLAIEDYIHELTGNFAKNKDIEDIRTHEVRAMSTDPRKSFGSMKVYDCFVYETIHNNTTYILFDGQWFGVSDDYYQEVEQSYLEVLKPAFLSSSTAKNERALISELCDPRYTDLLCMDQTKVSPTGANGSNLEPCDFFSKQQQFIHLKDSEASAPLSHLWNQGLVSAQSFRLDSKFRKDARREAGKRETKHARSGFVNLLPKVANINPSDFTIVYGVLKKMNARTKKLNIPFFSKVALRGVVEQLTMMGYKTELHLIEKL